MGTQKDWDKKYQEKFKFMKIRFTPEEMQDLNLHCESINIPKAVFVKNTVLEKIYGGNKMKLKKENWQFAIIDCWNEKKISKSEVNRLLDIGGNLDEIMKVDLQAVDALYPFLSEEDKKTLKNFIKNKFDFDEV